MENLFDLKYGVAGVCVLLTLSLAIKMIEILLKVKEKKEALSDEALRELTKAARALDSRIHHLEQTLSDLPKLKIDLRRIFMAAKLLSGEKWPDIRKQIMEEDL
jgi:hypothetical protein